MPPATQFESGSTSRLRAILTRLTQFAVVGTIVLGACDRTIFAPTKVQEPGTIPENSIGMLGGPRGSLQTSALTTGLQHEVTYSGKVLLSVDGLGTNNQSGIIQVEKPAGGTVLAAYMAATTIPGGTLAFMNVTIDGSLVTWTQNVPSAIGGTNTWGDVTSLVKPKIDLAAAGRVDFSIAEANTGVVDGEVLAVIFSVPSLTRDNTIVLMFGTQQLAGDDFSITTAQPIDTSDPALKINMSLGIGYSFQPGGQVSTVDVNGSRLSSSAGGQDDGSGVNGALLTVGGLDDSNTNPSPLAPATDTRTDDELYNIVPFVTNGSSSVLVHTTNPSGDDNIFFAAFDMNVSGNVNCESTPPTVGVTGVITGPPKQIQITVQDAGSGIQSIVVFKSDNADTVVPPFVTGTTDPVVVTATKIDQTSSSVIGLTATDACGNVNTFDPVDLSLSSAQGLHALGETSRFVSATGISDLEHFVMVQNGNPGLKSVTVIANGKQFEISDLKPGETRSGINIGSAMEKGENNTVMFRSKGRFGATGIAVLYQ
ncbi:MAG TPA: hypothetical protein VNC11_01145 [Gemmatimonadaceae bacterium]|nr:hypothetical protein [Gemmatimonadaceae bacterium]